MKIWWVLPIKAISSVFCLIFPFILYPISLILYICSWFRTKDAAEPRWLITLMQCWFLLILASFICFFQILENWKLSKFIFQFLEKYFSNFRIFGKMIFQKLENKLETFQFSKFWKKQMNDANISTLSLYLFY